MNQDQAAQIRAGIRYARKLQELVELGDVSALLISATFRAYSRRLEWRAIERTLHNIHMKNIKAKFGGKS